MTKAIAEVTDKPITHVVYSHSHIDHIGGTRALGGSPIIIAHDETPAAEASRRSEPAAADGDVRRPVHAARRRKVLELSYHGNAHEPGNIFISAPAQRVLMVVDVVFPGWMPWRRFALAQDIPGYFAQVEEMGRWTGMSLVGGHVARAGTHADVELQAEFNRDIKQAAATALATTQFGVGLNPREWQPMGGFDNYIDRVAGQCVKPSRPSGRESWPASMCTSGTSATRWSRASASSSPCPPSRRARTLSHVHELTLPSEGPMSGATQIHDQAGPAAPRGTSRGRGTAVKGAMLLDAVLDQMADGVIIADAEGRIRRVNPAAARMHGRAVTDIAPEDWSRSYDLLRTDGEPYPPEELALTRAVRDGEVVEGEEWIVRRPDGSQVRLLGSAAPLRDHRGRRLGAVLVMRDVTERERLAQALRAETAAKERFFAQMSHELRTPVNAVSGYCTLLLDGVAGAAPGAPRRG